MAEKPIRERIITPPFRVCFPAVFARAKAMVGNEGKETKYEVTAVFDPASFSPEDKKRWEAMRSIANKCSETAFKKALKDLGPTYRTPMRDGAEKAHLAGFGAGLIFCKMSTKVKPGVVASDGKTPITDDASFYPGCYARAEVSAYSYTTVTKGVAFGLHSLMFVRDGDRLDATSDPEAAFADFGEASVAADEKSVAGLF